MTACDAWVQNGPIALNEKFFRKTINIILMEPWPLLPLWDIQEKFFELIQSYDHASFLGPKWPTCLKKESFWKNH